MDRILSNTKKIEYKAYNDHWTKRIGNKPHKAINFLCGQKCYKFTVEKIEVIDTPTEIIGKEVPTTRCFAIHLGKRIH